ncbi:hypothetical protein EFQ99_25415 [Rhizobium vallis]|uniref:Propionyl-coenzyme A carboxylase alpha polypeptide n=1 Tax=Rhizobium vallis TaxID=634290 RepID=A0A3S0SNF8_9HYPH|nr:hypothetical protein EFQ99_25415 [Rhizobium vallis]
MAPPSVLPDISPTRVEIGWAHGLPQTTGRHMGRKFRARHGFLPISPLVGEMSGRTEGGVPRYALSKLPRRAGRSPEGCAPLRLRFRAAAAT